MKFKSILMATAIMMLTLCGLIAQNSKNSKILVMYFSWGGTTEKNGKDDFLTGRNKRSQRDHQKRKALRKRPSPCSPSLTNTI